MTIPNAAKRPNAPTARARAAVGLACALFCAGCTRAAPAPPAPSLSLAELHDARSLTAADVARLAGVPRADYRQTLTISIHDELSKRGFEGRGVVAVRPSRALRMILLGPGGTTAMDVWIGDGRFRVAIPALDRVIHGDRSTPRDRMRGLPVDLLDRWLIRPFGGVVVAARSGVVTESGVRPGEGFVAWLKRPSGFEVRAREGLREEGWFFEHGRLSGVAEGKAIRVDGALFAGVVDYRGLDPAMHVHVETDAPVVAALPDGTFADPDAR